MSFLKDIEKFHASKLRQCNTVVSTSDGRRLLETKDGTGVYSQKNIGMNHLGILNTTTILLRTGILINFQFRRFFFNFYWTDQQRL